MKCYMRFRCSKMKFVIALLSFVLSLFLQETKADVYKIPPEIKELLENFHAVCKDSTGVDQSVVDEVHKAVFSEDPKLKCYFKCMMQQMQCMTEDGKLNMEFIEASIPEELKEKGALETIKKCQNVMASDPCEAAFEMIKCLHRENEALSIMFE